MIRALLCRLPVIKITPYRFPRLGLFITILISFVYPTFCVNYQYVLPKKHGLIIMLKIYVCLLLTFVYSHTHAQVLDDKALEKIENGETTTLKNQFVVYLADTASPAYIERQLSSLGYSFKNLNVDPIRINLANSPDQSIIDDLLSKPEILNHLQYTVEFDSLNFKQQLSEQGVNDERIKQSMQRYLSTFNEKKVRIEFNYDMNEQDVINFMTDFRSVAYNIIPVQAKTVTILVEEGTENDVMLEVEKLPFVEYTALIGVLIE